MLIRHSALYIAAKLLPGALGMATTALLTRLLPPDRYGSYGVALVIMSFGATIGFEWLGLTYLRLARAQPDQALAAGTFNRLFVAALALAGLIGAVALAAVPEPDRATVASGFALMAAYAFFEFRARFPVANLAPGAYLRMNVGRAALILIAAVGAAWSTGDPVATACATALATLAAAFAGGATVRGRGFDRQLARAAVAFGLPLAASLALNSATNSATRGLIGGLGGVEALGLFTAAFVLVQNTLVVLSSGVASAGFALAVRALEAGDPAEARRQLLANGTLLLAVLAPAALGMALTADSLAATLVGPAFRDAVRQLTPLLAAAAFLTGLRSHYFDHAFQLGRHVRGQVVVTAVAAVVTLGLDAVLIPARGAQGAAVALLVGSAVAAVHAAVAGSRAFALPFPAAAAARIAASCALMAAGVLAVPGSGPSALAGKIAVGLVTYAVAAAALDVMGLRRALWRRWSPVRRRPA